jgi:RND family efflux transporter MFP subunit
VTVSKPIVKQVVDNDDYEGRIAAVKKPEIRARVRGELIKVNFKEGQMVKAGELLYEIDPRQYKAALDAAKARVKAADASMQYAQAEYDRTESLVNKKAASQFELETWRAKKLIARADMLKAQAAVQEADLNMKFTRVTAPISGRISRTQVPEGNLVNVGGGETLLTTITTVDPMYVYFNVDERSLLRYRKAYPRKKGAQGKPLPIKDLNIPVYVALEGDQGYSHEGKIDFADNQVNPKTGTIQVRGVLPNPDGLLDDGMRARVQIPVSSPYKAVMVAERAIGTEQGRKFVYVVNNENVVQQRDVTLGRLFNGLQVIEQGLKGNERVVSNGIQRVREGMKVNPQEAPMPGAR